MWKVSLLAICVTIVGLLDCVGSASDVVKVFVLAGQSNMEGKAKNELLEFQANDEKTRSAFTHLRSGGKWIVRDDAFIKFLGRHGGLTIGYGSPNRTGPELEFGNVVAEHLDEPVLLIKTAWGGHSLFQKFRSPSAGMPSEESLKEELEKAKTRVQKNNEKRGRSDPIPTMDDIRAPYGSSYRNMLAEVKETLRDMDSLFPELKGLKPEIAGFVWFQGWNDQYGAQDAYASNMEHFIRDVRRDFESAKLPFVIGVMGQNGTREPKLPMATIQKAQLSMELIGDFAGNVKAVRTDRLVDTAAEELFPEWQDRQEEWQKVGSDRGYHYYGSALWFNRIGRSMGQAMVELLH